MDIQKCNDIYTKLYSLVIKEFELKEISEPILNFTIFETHFSFFPFGSISAVTSSPPNDWGSFYENGGKVSQYQELSDGGDALSFVCAIEEEFDIEISDEVSKEIVTFKDVFGVILNIKYNIDIGKYLELEMRKKSLKLMIFLKENGISIANFKEVFLNDNFSKNHELLSSFSYNLRGKNIDVNKIIEFSNVLKSDFLLPKLDLICKLFYFMNDNKTTYVDIIEIINNNYLESCREELIAVIA